MSQQLRGSGVRHGGASRRYGTGLTIIEILIAMLVISIGLLGVAGLHSFSLRNNYDALMRSHASALAADIADRMRANRESALNGDYDVDMDTDVDVSEDDAPMWAIDLNEWRTALTAALPQGKGEVSTDVTGVVTIRIQWGERGIDDEDGMSFVTETEI